MSETSREFDNTATDAGVVATLAARAAKVEKMDVGGVPFLVLHGAEGTRLESLEGFLPAPVRINQAVQTPDVESFNRYVERWKSANTYLFADSKQLAVKALFDYHTRGDLTKYAVTAAYKAHTALLKLRPTPEWEAWLKINRQHLTQEAFAEFLEDQIATISEPVGAEVYEAARDLEATKSVSFRSAKNLRDGSVQFLYDEAVETKGKGEITLPNRFTLLIAPFDHAPTFKLEARLRYRIHEGGVKFIVVLDHPEKVQEEAFGQVLTAVADETSLQPYLVSALP